ncbi:hypothetical protein [Nocardiopsis sp. JB363]|uniref:hypothetical protein n=1 Tax=Nocardiopsis sp. JB363 TaxID=1434837 RepID=UPI00097B5CC3|nr:hypothetical protein [Nocardiopsis sp. JB363]SIO85622.1 hypothetical protein BQ8420_07880 [Nocardiopsis sp. JB363]
MFQIETLHNYVERPGPKEVLEHRQRREVLWERRRRREARRTERRADRRTRRAFDT